MKIHGNGKENAHVKKFANDIECHFSGIHAYVLDTRRRFVNENIDKIANLR